METGREERKQVAKTSTATEEKKLTAETTTGRESAAGYYPIFDECWGIEKRFPLPAGHTLKAAMLIPENKEVVGIVRCHDSLKFYCRRVQLDTLKFKDTNLDILMMRHISPVFALFRDKERGDFLVTSDIVEGHMTICDLSGKCLQALQFEEKKEYGKVLSIDRLNAHQLISLHLDAINIWDLATGEIVNSLPAKRRPIFANLFSSGASKIKVLKNGRVIVTNPPGGSAGCYPGSSTIFVWRDNKLEEVNTVDYYFLCETDNGVVALDKNQIRLLHNETLEETAHSARPSYFLTLLNFLLLKRPPVAIRQQNGCINLVTMGDNLHGLSEIFSPTLESMGEYVFSPEAIVNAQAFCNAPFSFYPNGIFLGDLLKYCAEWQVGSKRQVDLNKKQEAVVSHIPVDVLASLVMEYCAEDENIPSKTIPLSDLRQFTQSLINCLNDKEKFSPYRNNLIGSLIFRPAVHAESKNVLIAEVQGILDEMKEADDTFIFEERLTTAINKFWNALRKGESSRYQTSLSEFLQADRLHQRSNTWEDLGDGPPKVTEKFTVSQLRCLIASFIERKTNTMHVR